jgi:hypothetical protein
MIAPEEIREVLASDEWGPGPCAPREHLGRHPRRPGAGHHEEPAEAPDG